MATRAAPGLSNSPSPTGPKAPIPALNIPAGLPKSLTDSQMDGGATVQPNPNTLTIRRAPDKPRNV